MGSTMASERLLPDAKATGARPENALIENCEGYPENKSVSPIPMLGAESFSDDVSDEKQNPDLRNLMQGADAAIQFLEERPTTDSDDFKADVHVEVKTHTYDWKPFHALEYDEKNKCFPEDIKKKTIRDMFLDPLNKDNGDLDEDGLSDYEKGKQFLKRSL